MNQVVPQSYDEVILLWEPKIRTTIRGWTLLRDDEDDIFQSLMADFIAGDYLDIYDAEKGAFSTFIYAFVRVRLLKLHNQKKRWYAHNVSLDRYSMSSHFDVEDGRDYGAYIEFTDGMEYFTKELDAMPRTSTRMLRDMGKLWRNVMRMVERTGRIDSRELAYQQGVSHSSIFNHLRLLRQKLRQYQITGEVGT